jgi:sugar O-acyltransferase (sialic acid O-acetyltransferase NeuD family)
MIVIGAGGLAKQIIDVIERFEKVEEVLFYDDVSVYSDNPKLYKYLIIQDVNVLHEYAKKSSNTLVLGIGKPSSRKLLYTFFTSRGLIFRNLIGNSALIGNYDIEIGEGTVILENVIIESSVKIGKGVLFNTGSKVFHDSIIGDFCELAPNSIISANCIVGNEVYIGANSIILQGVIIGDGVIIGAGKIIAENIFKN